MLQPELLSTEPDEKRYYQLLKLRCIELVFSISEPIGLSIEDAKTLFRSITEEKWGSAEKGPE